MTVFKCPQCNEDFQSDVAGVVKCPNCQAEVRVEEPPMIGAPWDGKGKGWLSNYIQTIKLSLTKPTYFFEGVGRGDGYAKPVVFAMINALIVATLVAAYQIGFQTFLMGANVAINIKEAIAPFFVAAPIGIFMIIFGLVFLVPIITIIGLLITSGLYHLCLMILGATSRPFIQTFRVVCYSTGPQLAQILPIAGGMIAGIWQLVLSIIGLKVVHRTTYGKTVLAVFLPLIFCCGAIILFVVAIAGGVIGALFSAMPTS